MSNQTGQSSDFEHFPADVSKDETDVSLRAYLEGLSDEHLRRYQPDWSDEQVIEWDGNFRSDECLMLVCCERDVQVAEFRRVLEQYLVFRGLRQ